MRGKVSKITMFLLMLCMTVSMFAVNVSAAGESDAIDDCARIVEAYDLDDAEDYINDEDANTYPTCKTEGYLFAGWYTDSACGEDSYWGEQEPGDTVYALFVPSHILGVKAQISSNLLDGDTSNDGTASIRFVTTVDTLYYRQAGFTVSYVNSEGTTKNVTNSSNIVYKKLYAVGATATDDESDDVDYTEENVLQYTPSGTFCGISTYFKACTVRNIGSDYYTTPFTVTPFWKTMDGSIVYGETVIKSINDYFLEEEVWVSSTDANAADTVENGSEDKPFATLNYALGMVKNQGTVHVKDSYTADSNFVWKDHDKTVTITGGTIDFTGVPTKTIGSVEKAVLDINDSVTFTNTTLTFADGQHIYANGNSVEIAKDVTWGNSSAYVQIYGGAYNTTLNSDTNLVLRAGNYTRVFGGSNGGTLNGDTNVTLSDTINGALATDEVYKEHETVYVAFGAGENSSKLNGDTNLTIASDTVYFQYVFGGGDSGTVKGDCHVNYTGKAMGVYAGGKSGQITGNTYFTMTGGWVEQVFGGCESASVVGNTNVNIQGGTVKRRVYGGCYNNLSSSGTWATNTVSVSGHTNVSIGPNVTLSLDYQDPDALNMKIDNSLFSISRTGSLLENEWGAFIFNADSYTNTYSSKMGYNDSLYAGKFPSQTYHYLITTNGNTADGSYGTVSSENDYIRIEPKSGYSATVTVAGTKEYYTESNGVFKLPELTNTTDTRNIVVTFGAIDSSVDKSGYEAKIDGAYYDTLEEAVDAAKVLETEDTITVTLLKDAEIEETMAITETGNITVKGDSNYTINRADAMRDASIFTVEDGSTLTVDNVVLDGRTTTDISSNITDLDTLEGSTSSLILNDGTVNLLNMKAQYAVKTEENGAVLQSWGKTDVVTVENSTFSYNKAPGQGAAIRMGGGTGKLEVSNSTFEYNEVYTLTSADEEGTVYTGNGGAIGTHAEIATIDNCKFVGNTATGDATNNDACAGAVYSGTNSVVTMTGSDENALFSENSVTNGHGGAVAAGSGKVTITGYTFTANTSTGNGGVILSQGESTKIKAVSCTFEENTATGSGGVAYVAGLGTLIFNKDADSTVEALAKNNTAGANGGVTAQGSDTVIKVTGYKLEGNSAQYGGAIRVNSDARSATIKNTEFVSNTSAQPGGAIQSYSLLTVTGSTFTGNTSGNAGGAIHNAGNDSSINDCTFTSNKAGTHGGALCTDTAISIADSEFTSNNAGDDSNKYGGAIYTGKNIEITVDNCGFTSNNATHGGAIYMGTGTGNITDSEFNTNKAVWHGGAIYSKGTLIVTSSDFGSNTVTSGQGGAIKLDGSANGTITNSNFKKNGAKNGGAIHNEGTNVTVDVCAFEENTSVNNGGAINTNTTMIITGSTFTSNVSTNGNGGAFYSGKNVTNAITGCDFVSDSAVYGGAIYLEDGALTADDCEFYGNTSTNEGGAVWTNADTTTIKNSIFGAADKGNTSGANGGALYIAETKTANVENTIFEANSAVNGGAIECHNSTLNVTSCHFIGNTATTDDVTGFAGRGGGAVNLVANAKATFDGTGTFESNTATNAWGGAIYTTDAQLTISGYTFTSNSAKYAGAIMIDNVTEVTTPDDESTTDVDETEYDVLCTTEITINDSKFTENHSDVYGGAIYSKTRTLKLTKTNADAEAVFNANTSDSVGGAVCSNGSTVIVQGYSFDTNNASEGGAIWSNSSLTVIGSTFDANTSTGVGGAIEHIGTVGTIEDTTFSNNVAGNAGGAIINKGTDTSVSGCTFTSNTSATNGGAICTDTAMTITGSTFTSNVATSKGGAFYNHKNVTNIITSCNFVSDSAVYGGAIYLNMGTLTADDCEFYENTSTNEGGAVWTNASTTTIKNSTFGATDRGNTSETNGGALYIAETKTVNVENTTFEANSAVNGGAIECHNSTLNATSCHFIGNIATTEDVTGFAGRGGGAVNITGNAKATFDGTGTFESNTATTGQGGAIYTTDAELSISGYTFTSNSAKQAGAIMIDNVTEITTPDDESTTDVDETEYEALCTTEITINDSKFIKNSSTSNGGAIYLVERTLNLAKTTTDAEALFDGNTAKEGGAIWSNGSLSVNGLTFSANESTGVGGAIEHIGAAGTFINTTFSNNVAGNAGGAIINKGTGTSVSGCTFTSNTSATNGGAICTDTAISITGSDFTSNGATSNGGAFYTAKNVTITINSGTFTGNEAIQGGAIFDNAGSLNATGVTFDSNTSTGIGGAIKLGAAGTLRDCKFLNNSATGSAGGAIHNANVGTLISGCTFDTNTTATNGGAICTDTAITVENSTFTSNEANTGSVKTQGGGAIFTGNNIEITIDKCEFTSNKSVGAEDSFGGAIYMKNGTLKMDSANGTTFTSNAATHGGAIYMAAGTGNISMSEFKSNTSVWPGGAIYSKGTLKVEDSDFEENKAGNAGGAIKLDGSANGTITDCDFKKNKANNGGAIHEQGNSMSVSGCLFEENAATSGKGGAINGQKNTKTIDACTFTSNTATGDGKAIYFENGTLDLKNSIFNNYATTDIYINSNATLNEENNTKNEN